MPPTLPAAVPSAYPMLRFNGGLGRTRAADHGGGGSIGALADSRMQRLEWPPLSQTATPRTFLSTSAEPGIAGSHRGQRPWRRSLAHHLVRGPSVALAKARREVNRLLFQGLLSQTGHFREPQPHAGYGGQRSTECRLPPGRRGCPSTRQRPAIWQCRSFPRQGPPSACDPPA